MLTSILQPTHLIIVLIVALLVLGPKRLPEAGRAVGQGLKEFKSSVSGSHDDAQDQIEVAPRSTRVEDALEIEQANSSEADAR
jgi:sec-independent protein translocase protein TatA